MSPQSSYDDLELAASLLEDVLAQRAEPEKALGLWPMASNENHRLLQKAWTRLRHFADDSDLHKVDPSYLQAEKNRLKKCAAELMSHGKVLREDLG